ncbi:MAG: DUF4832 domain-containing protein, partial [Gelidibacter sp.]
TYLNLDYYGPVLNVWRNNSCFTDFQRKLGYRLLLKSAALSKQVKANGSFQLNAILSNAGFAPVYNPKNAFLVFKANDGTLYQKALELDVRKIVPNVNFELKETVNLSGIPAGNYELFLKIADPSASIADRPEFSIQLANMESWDATHALNKLRHTLTIN